MASSQASKLYEYEILHTTVLRIGFNQTTFFGLEKSGFIFVTLMLSGGISTNDITVTVTPSDQSPVSAEG